MQFYGVTYLKEGRLLFERLFYEISSQQILAQVSSKQGMLIAWKQVKKATRSKGGFLLVISKTHLIYWPYKIFNSKHERKLVEMILQRKGFLDKGLGWWWMRLAHFSDRALCSMHALSSPHWAKFLG